MNYKALLQLAGIGYRPKSLNEFTQALVTGTILKERGVSVLFGEGLRPRIDVLKNAFDARG